MMKKKVLLSATVLMVILLLVILLQLSTSQLASAARKTPTLSSAQRDMLDVIEIAKQRMTRSPNDPTEISAASTKIAKHSYGATEMAKEAENPRNPEKKTVPPNPPADTPIPLPTGIYQRDLSTTKDKIENAWFGRIMGQWIYVYAGATADDANQGIVYVFVSDEPKTKSIRAKYLTPIRSGSVHIESFSGTRLILKTSNGDTLYFDAAAQAFLSSPDEVVPTLTPLPNVTPTLNLSTPVMLPEPLWTPQPYP